METVSPIRPKLFKNLYKRHTVNRILPTTLPVSCERPGSSLAVVDDYFAHGLDLASPGALVALQKEICLAKRREDNTVEINPIHWLGHMCWAVKFCQHNPNIFAFTTLAELKVMDINTQNLLVTHKKSDRTLCWHPTNPSLIGVCCSDSVGIIDMRAPNEWVCMTAISSKPDTIDWSPDGNSIVTGHVNHEIRLRDIRNFDTTRILFTEHKCAVKTVKWSPWRHNEIYSAGGVNDRTILRWNSNTGEVLSSKIGLGGQVSSISFNWVRREVLVCIGSPASCVELYKCPKLSHRIGSWSTGHRLRVLYSASYGSDVVTIGAEGWLVWWDVWKN